MRKTKGQVLVLACVTMLIMALTVMLSFNVGNAIHERIRLQSHADSIAFSGATLAARSLNTSAHLNRSIAAALSGLMSVHAYYAVADDVINQMNKSRDHMIRYANKEKPLCTPKTKIHCIHMASAYASAACYAGAAGKVSGKRDSGYESAISELQGMIVTFHKEQNTMIEWTKNQIGNGATVQKLHEINAPFASENLAAGATQSSYACAFEGSKIDGECAFINGKGSPSVLGASERDKVMSSVAMAARVELTSGTTNGRNMANTDYTNGPNKDTDTISKPPIFNQCKLMCGSDWETKVGKTSAWLGAEEHTNGSEKVEAKVTPEKLKTEWACGHGWKESDDVDGKSRDDRGTRGYQGVPCSDDNCFINFRMSTDPGISYNMPSTYGAVSQQLRLMGRWNPPTRPWEINQTGHVHAQNGQTAWDITLPPLNDGFAVAKGKAYFHQLGQGSGWNPAPNSFDPFWRSKLHPFGREELANLLGKAGDSNGQQITQGGAPVEGDREAQ